MKTFYFTFLSLLLLTISCTKDETLDYNPKSVFDCEFDDNPNFIGICLNGSTNASPNESLVFASKATSNFTEISWEIQTGNMSIVSIETSLANDLPKSLATIQFNSDFNGGTLKVIATNDTDSNFSEISNYTIIAE
jgi:hypothetical protein